jgi:hypothetical protein
VLQLKALLGQGQLRVERRRPVRVGVVHQELGRVGPTLLLALRVLALHVVQQEHVLLKAISSLSALLMNGLHK